MTLPRLIADARYDAGFEPAVVDACLVSGGGMAHIGDTSDEQWMEIIGAGSGRGGHTQ
jgi:hypothetical protein